MLSLILRKLAYLLLKEEIHSFFLRLRREKAIYYYKDLPNRIPSTLLSMLTAGEDIRFASHKGIDGKALLRAGWVLIRYQRLQGGSTIEQQLTRVLTNRYERSISRKLHELLLASCVGEVLTKEETLGVYLNIGYFGFQMKGIEAACFGLNYKLETLSLTQASKIVARLRYPEPSPVEISKQWEASLRKRSDYLASLVVKETLKREKISEPKLLFPGSRANLKLIERYPPPQNFLRAGAMIDEKSKELLIRGFISEGIPAMFKDAPLYYENLRNLVAQSLGINPKGVLLIGSGRLGYSLHPGKYGKPMNDRSDMDLAIISPPLFKKTVKVFEMWQRDIIFHRIKPSTKTEGRYWKENSLRIPRKIRRGFMDTHELPNTYVLPRNIDFLCMRIKNELHNFEKNDILPIARVSTRIYKDWDAFFAQNVLNFNYTLDEARRT